PEELDELGAQEDADEERGHARDEDPAEHAYSAPTTRSRPAEREPLIRTRSPGSASSSRMPRASSGLPAACFSPSNAAANGSASWPTVTSTSSPSSSALRPISRWKRSPSSPSSAI